MNENEIRKYAALMEELGLTGLELSDDRSKVRFERSAPVKDGEPQVYDMAEVPAVRNAEENGSYMSVKSPFVGIFYSAPAENADPFVSAGDRVRKGQTLCIIEAMKLMNEITAEEDGVVEEVSVANGSVVEYGSQLMLIKRI